MLFSLEQVRESLFDDSHFPMQADSSPKRIRPCHEPRPQYYTSIKWWVSNDEANIIYNVRVFGFPVYGPRWFGTSLHGHNQLSSW